ncbi:MAG: MMCAP2_0565 family pilin-like conjugal transfer protein [Patescibacteria group bacterium]
MKIIKQLLILFILVFLLVLPYFVFAVEPTMENQLKELGKEGGYDVGANEYTISEIVGTVVKAFLSLLGIIFIALMLYGGYTWMTASGDEEKVKKSKDIIRMAIIGLIIIIGSWVIWDFILYKVIIGT